MKFSIITINYNNRDGLRRTIESVVNQTFKDFEYIIIDGGSTDGSVDVIKEYSNKITYWVSEPDKGVYNAMNKGTKVASGEYCFYLNSGDIFADDNVLLKLSKEEWESDIICGNIFYCRTNTISNAPTELSLTFFIENTLPHQASFIRRSTIEEFPYDEDLRIASDWKFFVQALIINNKTYSTTNNLISKFESPGLSGMMENTGGDERYNTLVEFFSKQIIDDFLILYYGKDLYSMFFIKARDTNFKKITYTLCVLLIKLVAIFRPIKWIKAFPTFIRK